MENSKGDAAAPPRAVGSALFWRVFAVINVIAVGYVAWMIWQLSPRPVVNDFVMRMPVSQRTSLGAIGQTPVQDRLALPPGLPAAVPATPEAAAAIAIQSGEPMGMLKLDTSLRVPPKEADAKPGASPAAQK